MENSDTIAVAPRIDLQRFCAIENARHLLTRPFVKDGWRYATTGHICIRVRAATEEDDQPTPEEGNILFPPVERIFGDTPSTVPLPWPPAEYIRLPDRCPQCYGRGRIGCDECEERTCLVCDGKGEFEQDYANKVGDHFINPRYDKLIRSLPNVVYYPSPPGKNRMSGPLVFRFDGGQGCVMGMRPPTTEE